MAISKQDETMTVTEIQLTNLMFNIVGTSPLVIHAMSRKAQGELLFPSRKKNAAERATSLKHEPYEEFIEAAYRFRDEDDQPTRLYMPAGAFHGAMAHVAIDMAGAKKAQVARLTTVPGVKIPIFGMPQLMMSVVRSSDMNRTPDIRTLPILPEWACTITVQFVGTLITAQSITNLLANAGIIVGIGDGRPEKGKLSFGQFRLCSDDDAEFMRVCKSQRANQDKALADPSFYDLETEQLYRWFQEEKTKRSAAPIAAKKSNGPRQRENNLRHHQ